LAPPAPMVSSAEESLEKETRRADVAGLRLLD
jgi:hypothetical protein